jgi:hypothetical protein
MPTNVAAQMRRLVEQRGLAQGSKGLVGGNGAATNAGAGSSTASGFGGEGTDYQWTGTLRWRGTDSTRNLKKEVHAQVTAIASKGNPCAHSFLWVLGSSKTYIHAPIQISIDLAKEPVTRASRASRVIGGTSRMD